MLERFSIKLQRYRIPLLIAVFAVACLIPFCVQSAYVLRICVVALMNIILALSLNMMIGLLGQMSFGHAAFFGIGSLYGSTFIYKVKTSGRTDISGCHGYGWFGSGPFGTAGTEIKMVLFCYCNNGILLRS